ncbi:hypothetical protein VTN00DRAFT_1806 [Thermoascus crustaceus]|uniref:uncharacterized protein n=1 Tax=Thermoascus crustaceus TaxID=5088 RepID=UPI0037442864
MGKREIGMTHRVRAGDLPTTSTKRVGIKLDGATRDAPVHFISFYNKVERKYLPKTQQVVSTVISNAQQCSKQTFGLPFSIRGCGVASRKKKRFSKWIYRRMQVD